MKEKLKTVLEFVKKLFKNMMVYSIIVLTTVAAFFIGVYYYKTKTEKEGIKYEVTKVLKKDVNLAIDENNHLIVIQNKTGDYTIYQDSIGITIFKLYAKNVWGQHNTLTTETNK